MPINPQKIRIGRDAGCDIVIVDKSVSRKHADLLIDSSGGLEILDLNSSGGTYLLRGGKEEPITRANLKPSDTVILGEHKITVDELMLRVDAIVPKETPSVAKKIAPPPLPLQPKPAEAKAGAPGGRMVRCECGTIKKKGSTCPSCGV